MGQGTERWLKDRVPALSVSNLRAGNINMIIPALKELKQSFILSFTNSKSALRIYIHFCFCLLVSRSQDKEFVQRTRNRQAKLTCTFSYTHKVPHRNLFTHAESTRSSGRFNWVAQYNAAWKEGKVNEKSDLSHCVYSAPIPLYCWSQHMTFFIYSMHD